MRAEEEEKGKLSNDFVRPRIIIQYESQVSGGPVFCWFFHKGGLAILYIFS